VIDSVDPTRLHRRDQARRLLGVSPEPDVATVPLRQAFAGRGLSWYPLLALGLLAIVDTFHSYAFAVLAPDVSRTLGVGKGAIAAAVAVKTVALAIAPLPIAALSQRHARRALLCISMGVLWSAVAIGTGYVVLIWGLVVVLVADGLSTGSVAALHQPLLLDHYPANCRVRVLSAYQGANSIGNIVAPLGVAILAAGLGLTWRGVFIVLGALSLLAVLFASRLRDPGFGRWDEQQIRATVRHEAAPEAPPPPTVITDVSLGFFEIVRRLLLIPTVRRLLVAQAVFGVLIVPFQTFLFFFLEEEWNLGPGGRGLFFAFTAATALVTLGLFARFGERRFREDPGGLLRISGALLAMAVVLVCAGGLSPWFGPMIALFGLAFACIAVLVPAVNAVLFAVVPSQMRPHAAALVGIFLGGVGGVLGALFLSGIERRFGVGGALVSLLVPGLLGSLLLVRCGALVPDDLDRMIDEIIEDEEIRQVINSGGHLPLLSCRGVDFSYGRLQVLFDIDLTVDHGEMVGLLGVNGAGKSTLLRAISGIGLPSAGSVRFEGLDITYIDAERRLRLGITQIPGGRAVFGPVSVVDNLRGFGYTLGRDKGALDDALDRCFDAFPRLAERRNQHAGTLSGGEQQMLALSKALILEPKLLLIDELSLGLAPVIIEQLLEMVRRINASGTAVVLVEQSVNIALTLVDHAYFMEKGEIRFDGPARELLGRDDLLRAVFLEGVGAGGKATR
jgi:ABC-type branched-subunit amino acid transport system ATPase component